MSPFSLELHQWTVGKVYHSVPASVLYEQAIRYEQDASIAENGAPVEAGGPV